MAPGKVPWVHPMDMALASMELAGPNPGAAWCAGIWGAAGALGAGLGIGGTLSGVFGAGGPGLGKSSSEELGSLGGRGVGNLPFKGSFGLGRLGGVAGDGDLVGGGWNGSNSVEAAGLWTSSKLANVIYGSAAMGHMCWMCLVQVGGCFCGIECRGGGKRGFGAGGVDICHGGTGKLICS